MNFKNVSRSTLNFTFSAIFTLSQIPTFAFAGAAYQQPMNMEQIGLPTDLFPVDNVKKEKESSAQNQQQPQESRVNIPSSMRQAINPAGAGNQSSGNRVTMATAAVPEEYACPLFDNRPHSELMNAIDSLNKQVISNPGCKDDASAAAVSSNTETLKSSVTSIKQMTQITDPTKVNMSEIEASVTAAITATQNLGNILNNDSFLNSQCGRQTMSTGNALLALNNILNGLGPYALMAVSLNAALAPALPFVIGGIAVTSGISVATKMYKQNTLDMSKPEFRKALIQNTCQYIKVSKKVRFMELAQSGQITKITEELQNNIQAFKSRFSQPSQQLYSLLKIKDTSEKQFSATLEQITVDRMALVEVESQLAANTDDLMVCTYVRELVNSAQDDKSFPTRVVVNLENLVKVLGDVPTIQVTAMRSMHTASMTRITTLAKNAQTDEAALKACALTGHSWITGLRQTINTTLALVNKEQKLVDAKLSQHPEFRHWKSQYNQVKIEQVTVDRVEKALEALNQDNSIIDRSELSQRMSTLRAGLFGVSGMKVPIVSGAPPVLAWLRYTKTQFDQEAAKFIAGLEKLKEGDMSFSSTGKHPRQDLVIVGLVTPFYQATPLRKEIQKNMSNASKLRNINLKNLPLGSRQNEIACQQLEGAWLNWSSSLDHLGATQMYCNMIDDALNVGIDKAIVNFCRGKVDLNGRVNATSAINEAKSTLVKKGYQAAAIMISSKIKELKCPMPAISVMNR